VKGIQLVQNKVSALDVMDPMGNGIFSPGQNGRVLNPIIHLQPMTRLRMSGTKPPIPVCLHGVVLNQQKEFDWRKGIWGHSNEILHLN
jgi:hypothetical protein